MEPVVSVIVPVYKVEPYLRKCLDSICGQTLREIEIILVDDGSPDRCGQICDEYAARDSRIRVLHKENGGLSSARNAGIEIATADLLGFVDSDDWIEPDMFAHLYHNLEKENADISVCGHYVHKDGKITANSDSPYSVRSGAEAVRSIYQCSGVAMNVWNKPYRKELFSDLRFPDGQLFEDVVIMVRLMDSAKKVVYDMAPKYHYLIRTGSITTAPYRPGIFDKINATKENYRFLGEKYPELAHLAKDHCINAYFYVLFSLFLCQGTAEKDKERGCILYLKENSKEIFSSPGVSKKRKLLFMLLCIHPMLCKQTVRMFRKRI